MRCQIIRRIIRMPIDKPISKNFKPEILGEDNPVTVLIPEPDIVPERTFIGREEEINNCLTAWLDVKGQGALHFRISGPPGVGKNELVYYLARKMENKPKPLYIMHGHEELTPEDIACTAAITSNQGVEYVGSPLLAAMIRGGICFFDEIGKVPPRSLSLLASVLDDRRTLTSILGRFSVQAVPGFRFCAAMNDADAATYGLPDYIDERLRPVFKLGYPPIEELMEILRNRVGMAPSTLLEEFRKWVASQPNLSPRAALTLLSFAARLHHQENGAGELTRKKAIELI